MQKNCTLHWGSGVQRLHLHSWAQKSNMGQTKEVED